MANKPSFRVDRADPRAPSQAIWDALSVDERLEVLASLPNEVSIEEMAPEGDPHRKAKEGPLDALRRFFERIGRKVYLSSELAVYYPGEKRFVPDVLGVLDVEPHDRMKWVVSAEGKGLDFVLEVHVEGDKAKDHERNVALYARLGIPEYFIFDRGRLRLKAFRLKPGAALYEPIIPQAGRYASQVLGLDIVLEGDRLRFFHGTAPLHDADELIRKLDGMVDDLVTKREAAEQGREAAEQGREAAEHGREAAEQEREAAEKRADAAERRLAEALAEIERLKGTR
jgi:Uma2 family endonuclease